MLPNATITLALSILWKPWGFPQIEMSTRFPLESLNFTGKSDIMSLEHQLSAPLVSQSLALKRYHEDFDVLGLREGFCCQDQAVFCTFDHCHGAKADCKLAAGSHEDFAVDPWRRCHADFSVHPLSRCFADYFQGAAGCQLLLQALGSECSEAAAEGSAEVVELSYFPSGSLLGRQAQADAANLGGFQ